MTANTTFSYAPAPAMPERQKHIFGIIAGLIIAATILITTSCDSSSNSSSGEEEIIIPDHEPTPGITLFQNNAPFDYQLGGAYTPPSGTMILTRDRTDSPVSGLFNICYINGFQVQPDEEGDWDSDLILRDSNDDPIIDPDWDEMLLDISTADKRTRIAAVITGWIEDAATAGFDAVEIDNLDSYERSGGRLTKDNAVAFMALLSAAAHNNDLAIAQKNSTELLSRNAEMGTDFAVAEECSAWNECQDYVNVYGHHVLMIEYETDDFNEGCSKYGDTHSIILRDYELVTPADPEYVFDRC